MLGHPGSSTHIALLGWLYVYREVQTSMMNTTPAGSSEISQIRRNLSADGIQGTIMIHYYSSCRCIM